MLVEHADRMRLSLLGHKLDVDESEKRTTD